MKCHQLPRKMLRPIASQSLSLAFASDAKVSVPFQSSVEPQLRDALNRLNRQAEREAHAFPPQAVKLGPRRHLAAWARRSNLGFSCSWVMGTVLRVKATCAHAEERMEMRM